MIQEILYTSAPQGIKPGTSGYCTVLCTRGMPAPVVDTLESLSGYRHLHPPGTPQATHNPVNFGHYFIRIGGRKEHILSRVSDFRLDHTGRSNKLAHHLLLDNAGLVTQGPASVLLQDDVMHRSWNGEVKILDQVRKLTSREKPFQACQTWQSLAGDAGWAGVLAESYLSNPGRKVFIIYPLGTNVLKLFEEAISLIPVHQRWEVTFSTFGPALPATVDCLWNGIVEGTPEVHQSKRHANALRIDLTKDLPQATGGELVQAARTGVLPQKKSAAPAVAPPMPVNTQPQEQEVKGTKGTYAVRKPERNNVVEEKGEWLDGVPNVPPRLTKKSNNKLTILLVTSVCMLIIGFSVVSLYFFKDKLFNVVASNNHAGKKNKDQENQEAPVVNSNNNQPAENKKPEIETEKPKPKPEQPKIDEPKTDKETESGKMNNNDNLETQNPKDSINNNVMQNEGKSQEDLNKVKPDQKKVETPEYSKIPSDIYVVENFNLENTNDQLLVFNNNIENYRIEIENIEFYLPVYQKFIEQISIYKEDKKEYIDIKIVEKDNKDKVYYKFNLKLNNNILSSLTGTVINAGISEIYSNWFIYGYFKIKFKNQYTNIHLSKMMDPNHITYRIDEINNNDFLSDENKDYSNVKLNLDKNSIEHFREIMNRNYEYNIIFKYLINNKEEIIPLQLISEKQGTFEIYKKKINSTHVESYKFVFSPNEKKNNCLHFKIVPNKLNNKKNTFVTDANKLTGELKNHASDKGENSNIYKSIIINNIKTIEECDSAINEIEKLKVDNQVQKDALLDKIKKYKSLLNKYKDELKNNIVFINEINSIKLQCIDVKANYGQVTEFNNNQSIQEELLLLKISPSNE